MAMTRFSTLMSGEASNEQGEALAENRKLVLNINNRLLDELDRSTFLLWALVEQRRRMADQGRRLKLVDREEWTFWREMLAAHLSRLWLLKAAIAAVSATWFNGQCVLFSKQKTELDGEIQQAEILAALYNKVHRASPSWAPIELGGVPDPGKTRVLVREWEDLARAETLIACGESRAARRIFQAHVVHR